MRNCSAELVFRKVTNGYLAITYKNNLLPGFKYLENIVLWACYMERYLKFRIKRSTIPFIASVFGYRIISSCSFDLVNRKAFSWQGNVSKSRDTYFYDILEGTTYFVRWWPKRTSPSPVSQPPQPPAKVLRKQYTTAQGQGCREANPYTGTGLQSSCSHSTLEMHRYLTYF